MYTNNSSPGLGMAHNQPIDTAKEEKNYTNGSSKKSK